MQQEVSLQHEELAQAHQLGELQKEYRVRIDKTLLIFGAGLIFGVLFYLVEGGPRMYPLSLTDDLILLLIFTILPAIVLFRYRQLHVYVYTHGLLYLNGNTSLLTRWEQINKVHSFSGNTYVLVNDGSRIELSPYISGIGELRSTIKREMANQK